MNHHNLLSELSDYDTKLLTSGKLNEYLGVRDPLKMWRCNKTQRWKLKPLPAVYFLFSKSELVYIGKCTSLRGRIQDHIRGREHLKGYFANSDGRWRHDRKIPPKEFDTVSKIYLSLAGAEYIELIYIAHYRPKLNKCGIDKPHNQMDIFNGY